jgi:hypothetical protein
MEGVRPTVLTRRVATRFLTGPVTMAVDGVEVVEC